MLQDLHLQCANFVSILVIIILFSACFACLQALAVHEATFKGFVFCAERHLAFLSRRSGVIGGVDFAEQVDFDFAQLDSVAGLKKLLDRLTRRLERAKDRVDCVGHLNGSSIASYYGLNGNAESETQIW